MGARMGMFLSKEEIEAKKKKKAERKALEEKLSKTLGKVKFFPGSIKEYESLVGYEVEIIDTGDREIGVTFGKCQRHGVTDFGCYETLDCQQKLVDEGIEAIVNCKQCVENKGVTFSTYRRYGLPVRKKQKAYKKGYSIIE